MGNALPKMLGTGVIGVVLGFLAAASTRKKIADKPIAMDAVPSGGGLDELTPAEKLEGFWPRKVVILFGPPGAGKARTARRLRTSWESLRSLPAICSGRPLLLALRSASRQNR